MKFLKYQLTKGKTRSVPVASEPSHRWSTNCAKTGKMSVTPFPEDPGCNTIYAMTKRSVELYGPNKCMGSRIFKGQYKGNPKVKEFGETVWLTYDEMGAQANKFGAALAANGLVAAPSTTNLKQLTKPCSIAIFENTCAQWQIAAQGAFTQSMIVTTIYATLGMSAVIDAVADCKIRAIVCNKRSVKELVENISKVRR